MIAIAIARLSFNSRERVAS